MKPTIKIEPSNYRGWSLSYQESHDHVNDWIAKKGLAQVFSRNPEGLIHKIDEEETVTFRLKKPIKVLYQCPYQTNRVDASIHSVVDDRVYFTKADGTEGVCFLKNTRPGSDEKNPFIHNCRFNDKILAKHKRQAAKISFMATLNSELLKRLKPVTDADILIAAKESTKP